jgi:hypothetical protein
MHELEFTEAKYFGSIFTLKVFLGSVPPTGRDARQGVLIASYRDATK